MSCAAVHVAVVTSHQHLSQRRCVWYTTRVTGTPSTRGMMSPCSNSSTPAVQHSTAQHSTAPYVVAEAIEAALTSERSRLSGRR